MLFKPEDKIHNDFLDLIKNNDFKNDLNALFSKSDILELWSWEYDYCVSDGAFVLECIEGESSRRKICFQHNNISLEEADNRIVLHVRDLVTMRGKTNILVRTVDSDIPVILTGFFLQFYLYNSEVIISVDFGTGNIRRILSINECYNYLGEGDSLGVSFFHAFSGCDSTSFFTKRESQAYSPAGCNLRSVMNCQLHSKC